MKRALALGALLLATACHDDGDARLVIVITALGSPPGVVALEVRLNGPGGVSTNSYSRDGQKPISFPTTLSAQLPKYATGDLTIDVEAKDAASRMVASGQEDVTVRPGQTLTVYVRLECRGSACVVDGGSVDTDGGIPTPSPRCGNGRVDPGETCDTAIPAGAPGACPPPDCDDHVPCTKDTHSGSDCTAKCEHGDKQEIRDRLPGDGCCPAGARHGGKDNMDTDCSPTCGDGVVDPNETCDIGIARGMAGACPTDCPPAAACEDAKLVSGNTCSAVCVRYQIVDQTTTMQDGCCPPGATKAVDSDCPAACGNSVIDPGETCDVGIPALSPGACPTSCADDKPCTIDYFSNIGCQPACQHFPITTAVSGDGCCLPGSNQTQDTDCPAACDNGILERGETCDPKASCPKSCPTPPPGPSKRLGCLRIELVGDEDDCSARCVVREISACGPADECCPAGCTSKTDSDCSPSCGDGFLQFTSGEDCDVNAPPLELSRCPTSCTDSNPCTEDRLLSAGTCGARCVHLPITALRPGDGCCPPTAGGNAMLDPDCTPVCGNGFVEQPAERCDWAAGPCPSPESCPTNAYCTPYVLRGTECSAACVAMPITGCAGGDGCCPPGCSTANDSDCQAICGNGVVDADENCDRAITAGHQGACLGTCDDANACTVDVASGSTEGCTRTCVHQPVTACIAGDGCCPPGCSSANDRDCAPRCTDGRIGAGETCDPPSTCPTSCPDDGDPCTAEQLTGDAASCNVTCRHVPITTCVAAAGDACCPTGCTPANDWDC